MLDKQTNLIQQLQAEVRNVRYENDKLRPLLKDAQKKNDRFGKLYKQRELKVHEHAENELKISTQDIRFHAVHRVGKPAAQNVDNSTLTRPKPIIARFVSSEHTE